MIKERNPEVSKIYAKWIWVRDLAESRQFYEKALGVKVTLENSDWIEFRLGTTAFALLQRSESKGALAAEKTRTMFEVENIEEFAEHFRKNNIRTIGDIREESYGKLLTFEDPNGHWLELFEMKR